MKANEKIVKLSASMMCADLANLEVECLRLETAGIDRLHFDIMDGKFVDNIELGFSLIKRLKEISNLAFECHLMVLDPQRFIDILLESEVEYISIHFESVNETEYLLQKIRSNNSKAGIAVNPETDVDNIFPLLPNIDQILFMTVSPGFSGQPFKNEVLEKIKALKGIIEINKYNIEIETDGNMSDITIPKVVTNGADAIVLGSSSLFNRNNKSYGYKAIVKEIKRWTRSQ